MKKFFCSVLLVAIVSLSFVSCILNLNGNEVSYRTVGGSYREGWAFDSLDDLEDSLLYLEDKISGNITIGGLSSEFATFKSEKLSAQTFEGSYRPSYDSIQSNIVVEKEKVFHSVAYMGNGLYRGYYTWGISVYVYSPENGQYADGQTFDFGDKVKSSN